MPSGKKKASKKATSKKSSDHPRRSDPSKNAPQRGKPRDFSEKTGFGGMRELGRDEPDAQPPE